MVGKENVVMPNMSGLGEDFASQQLIDKSVAIIPDARLSPKKDIEAIVEKLLSISGEVLSVAVDDFQHVAAIQHDLP